MDNFVNRFTFLLETYDYTASAFADKIGVQRSSLSHLLSGRNKPSLDLILKIKTCFPELNLDWLIQGIGPFSNEQDQTTNTTPTLANHTSTAIEKNDTRIDSTAFNSLKKSTDIQSTPKQNTVDLLDDSTIEKVIVFYKDGTFKQYSSR